MKIEVLTEQLAKAQMTEVIKSTEVEKKKIEAALIASMANCTALLSNTDLTTLAAKHTALETHCKNLTKRVVSNEV